MKTERLSVQTDILFHAISHMAHEPIYIYLFKWECN